VREREREREREITFVVGDCVQSEKYREKIRTISVLPHLTL